VKVDLCLQPLRQIAAVHGDELAGDVGGIGQGEESGHAGNVSRLGQSPQRGRRDQILFKCGILQDFFHHFCASKPRQDAVDAHADRSPFHRDIKPSNIMVSLEEGGAVTAKIIDLGLAKGITEQGSQTAISTPGALKDVAQAVVVLLELLLEKDPARRFQTPAELGSALATAREAIASGSSLSRKSIGSGGPQHAELAQQSGWRAW
jgi:hypothetical protein